MIGKLVVDYEEVSLGDLLEFLTDKGIECCVDGDNIYVFDSNAKVHKIVVECDFIENNALINTMIVKNNLPIDLVLLLKRMTFELSKLNINTI